MFTPVEYSNSASRPARQDVPAVASFFSFESAARSSFHLMQNSLASSMIKKIKAMFLIYWAMIIVMLNQRRCGAVHLFKPELGSTSEHFISETSPDSIRAEEAASPSVNSAQIINPTDSPPHSCTKEKEVMTHTTNSKPTPSSRSVDQHIYQQFPISPRTADPGKDNPNTNLRSTAKPKSTVRNADQNKVQGSRPIFSLGGDFPEVHAVPIYSTPSMHRPFSSSSGVDVMGQRHLEPYSYSGYPIQQCQYHTVQHGFHVPPPLVDSVSGITYVPYYPAVSTSSPLYTHFSSYFQPSIMYPPITAYSTPRPLYWRNNNDQHYGFRNPSTYRRVELKNPRQENSMDIPLQSDGRYTALKSNKIGRVSVPRSSLYPTRSPEPAREKQFQTTELDENVKETDIESHGKSIADQPLVRKFQLNQEAAMNKRYPPSTADKLTSDIGESSVSELQDISGQSRNNVDQRDLRLTRPQYSGSVKSKQHVNNLIASSMNLGGTDYLDDNQTIAHNAGFGQAEGVMIGENWVSLQPHRDILSSSVLQSREKQAASPTRKILMPWSAEQGRADKSTTPRPSGEISKFVDQQDSHVRHETLDMDLLIRKLKDLEAFPTLHSTKDSYIYEKEKNTGKDFALRSVRPVQSEKQPPKSSGEVSTKPYSVLNLSASREAEINTSKTESKVTRENVRKAQNLKKGTLKYSKTVVSKHNPHVSTLKEYDSSLNDTTEPKHNDFEGTKTFRKVINTEIENPPDLTVPPEKHTQKDGFLREPRLKKTLHEGSISRNMRKCDHPNIVEKKKVNLFDASLKDITHQEKAHIHTSRKYIQTCEDRKDSSLEKPLPNKKKIDILENDDAKDINEKFVVPSNLKSSKSKKENSGRSKKNTNKIAISKPSSGSTSDEDKQPKTYEDVTESNYAHFERSIPRLPDLKVSKYLEAIPPIQEGVFRLWNWMKTAPDPILSKLNWNGIPKWVPTDALSSISTDIDSLGTTSNAPYKRPDIGVESNAGLLEQVSTKISDLRSSISFGKLLPMKNQVSPLWSWIKATPEAIWTRRNELWVRKATQEETIEVVDDKEVVGQGFPIITRGKNNHLVDEGNTENSKCFSKDPRAQNKEKIVQDESHNTSLNTEAECPVNNPSQLDYVQISTPSTSNGPSSKQSNTNLSASEAEKINIICKMLKLKNKKKFLPLELTLDDYMQIKNNIGNSVSELYKSVTKKSQLPIGEFTRRTIVFHHQIKQHELLNFCSEENNALSKSTKDCLKRMIKGDVPWPTFTNCNKKELKTMNDELECTFQNPSALNVYQALVGAELKVRKEIISYMLNRKTSNKWWDEEKLQEGRKQAINVVRVLSIGDILEFGERDISKTSLKKESKVSEKMESLYKAFISPGEKVFPWNESPEREWLESQPELWRLYQERLRLVILAFETLTSSQNCIVVAENGVNNENSWWQFGDYLMWIDEGINRHPIPSIGDSLKLGKDKAKNAKILESVNWKEKLKKYDLETRRKIQVYFEKRRILNSSEIHLETPVSIAGKIKSIFQSSIP